MSKPRNPLRVIHSVLQHAQKNDDAKHHPVQGVELEPRIARLREFQAQRIAQTYSDFAAQPQYAPALQFFLSDLYAARDFTQRDHDAERAHNFLSKIVPAEMLKLTTDAIELTRLSHMLDEAMLCVLIEQLGFETALASEMYAEAYRRCDDYARRERQIELLVCVMHDSAEAAHFPLTGAALRMAKGPALAAGWHEMYDFLQRGFLAFKSVKQPEVLLAAIAERETQIMERIRRGEPEPFQT